MKAHWMVFLLVTLLGALLDIVSKYMVFHQVPLGHSVDIVSGILAFKTITNTGIIFGKFQNAGPLFLIISAIAVPIIVVLFATIKKPKWLLTVSLGLILAGTCGNMYDRILTQFKVEGFHGVRDFIHFYTINWPIFNLADAFICIGVLLLAVDIIFSKDQPEPAAVPAAIPPVGPVNPTESEYHDKNSEVGGTTAPPQDANLPAPDPPDPKSQG